jgi:hypothetical protein
MERSFVVRENRDVLSRLLLPEDFSMKGQTLHISASGSSSTILLSAPDEKSLDKFERSVKSTLQVFEKMRGVVHAR